MCHKLEYECEEASVKEILQNAIVNNRKIFIGVQGKGKYKNNVLVISHRGIMSHGREQIKDNYGGK